MPDFLIWPAVVVVCIVILGIAALFILRPAFAKLVGRTSKVGKDGISFESSQERGSDNKPVLLSFPDLMKAPISATVLGREDYLKDQLHSLNLQNDKEKIEVLVRIAASARIEKEFSDIAHTIFGSQLDLLVQLSGTPSGFQIERAESIFKQAQETYPDTHKNRTIEEWLKFIISNNLITIENNKIDITRYGSDFLKFLVDARLAYQRHG